MTLDDVLKRDEWLSIQIGKPAYRVRCELLSGFEAADAGRILTADLSEPGRFYYAGVNCAETACIQALLKSGFYYTEASVQLRRDLYQELLSVQPGVVRPAVESDRMAVAAIAYNSFNISRFHSDPKIDKSVAKMIKQEWVTNFFRGNRGTDLLVSDRDGTTNGFLLLISMKPELIIDLIAVDQAAFGQGVASALIGTAMNLFKDHQTISVTTELKNYSALRLYCRLGFNVVGTRYYFHKHC